MHVCFHDFFFHIKYLTGTRNAMLKVMKKQNEVSIVGYKSKPNLNENIKLVFEAFQMPQMFTKKKYFLEDVEFGSVHDGKK